MAAFRRAVELAPASSDVHLNLAHALRQLGRTSEAEEHSREARRLGGGR